MNAALSSTWIFNPCIETCYSTSSLTLKCQNMLVSDAAHLELLIDSGFKIATNQVSCSVIDRRLVRGRPSKACADNDVGILAYGTLLGGYISEKWLGKPEPENLESLNWSLKKYLRFIKAAGGWAAYQGVLAALDTIAKRHQVSIAAGRMV